MPGSLVPLSGSNMVGGIDLNALLNSGGSLSLPISLGGSSNTSMAPATSSGTKNTTTSTSKTGAETTRTTGATTGTTALNTNKKLLDEQSLKILQDTIAAIASGQGNPLLSAIDTAKGTGITGAQALINGQDPNAAVDRAGGRVADLTRQLNEQALSTLMGNTEASGFGGNALSMLLAQDAAVRTGEAQARVQEEAYNQAIGNQLTGYQVLNQLLQGGSAVQEALMQALNTAKGATEVGTETGMSTTTSDEVANKVTSEQGSSTAKDTVTNTSIDPLEWIKALGTLQLAGGGQASGPSAVEKALALWPALGGRPSTLLNSFSSTPNLYSTAGVGASSSAQETFNKLVQMLGS